jgi:hypothetical protein
VISVSSPTSANVLKDAEKFQNLTFTKKKASIEADADVIGGSLKLNRASKLPPATQPRVRASKSRESLNSVSSPTTPTSPLISSTEDFGMSPREGLGVINSSIRCRCDKTVLLRNFTFLRHERVCLMLPNMPNFV